MIHHERDVREEQKYMYVARTSNNRVISSGHLYCCLLPRCEALRTCRSGFPIATPPTIVTQYRQQCLKMSVELMCKCNGYAIRLHVSGFRFKSHLADFGFVIFVSTFLQGQLSLGLGQDWLGQHLVWIRVTVRFRVYLLHLLRFYQAYCTLVMRYCHVTEGGRLRLQI